MTTSSRPFQGAIFDVDGVLVASPHERAWREALSELMAGEWSDLAARIGFRPECFTTTVYQTVVAGKPRLDGARAALVHFGVPDAEPRAVLYAARKQRLLEALIEAGAFEAYPDALRFVLRLKARGLRLAAASSSRNANRFLERIPLAATAEREGLTALLPTPGATLLDIFDANVCGRELPHGKPHPAIFLLAVEELGLEPGVCFVVEDAPVGIQAAQAGGLRALGVARLGDEALLQAAGADLVVTSLDQVALEPLRSGRLERLAAS